MKYIVYLTKNLKNKINGVHKIYVGVHQTENPEIFDGYIGCGCYKQRPSTYMYPKTPFQYAVKKYGVDAFERTILYIYDNKKEAYKKEEEIVDINFIKLDHTYNISLGGSNPSTCFPLYQFDLNGNLVKLWEYSTEAYDFYGYPMEKFSSAIQSKFAFLDSYWSRSENIIFNEYSNNKRGNPTTVYLYSKSGKYLKEFESQKECADYLGIKGLFKSVKEQALIKKEYYVSDKLVDEFVPKPRVNYMNKILYVYDVYNKFYGKFVGKEIMKVINLHSWDKIHQIFNTGKNWYKDFYLSESEITQVPNKKWINSISIDVFDKYGNFIETIKSVKETKEKYKVPAAKIKNIQKGDKFFGDYIFRYNSK